jgi:outer membrane lipoprotein carrier protein
VKARFLVASLAMTVGILPAQEPSLSDVTDGMQKRYAAMENIVADFSQKVHFGFSNIRQEFSGTLTFRKPNKLRMESEHQTLVTDGMTVWAYSPVNHQVVIDHYKENKNTITPDRFLVNLPENYYATILGTEQSAQSKNVILKLVPKDDTSFIRSVKLWVEHGSWVVKAIEITDVNETTTTYAIKSMVLNTNVAQSAFSFTPPPGTDIVDLR